MFCFPWAWFYAILRAAGKSVFIVCTIGWRWQHAGWRWQRAAISAAQARPASHTTAAPAAEFTCPYCIIARDLGSRLAATASALEGSTLATTALIASCQASFFL